MLTITRSDFQDAIEDGIETLVTDTPADYARLAARLRRAGREAQTFTTGDFGEGHHTNTPQSGYDRDRPGCPLTKAGVGVISDSLECTHGFVCGFWEAFDQCVFDAVKGREGASPYIVGDVTVVDSPEDARMSVVVEYSSNNSGGVWWLSDEDWEKLAKAGWNVHWGGYRYNNAGPLEPRERSYARWLGAAAVGAAKEFDDPQDAIAEFETLTGQSASEEGCECCGSPHSFSYRDENGVYRYFVEVTETGAVWA